VALRSRPGGSSALRLAQSARISARSLSKERERAECARFARIACAPSLIARASCGIAVLRDDDRRPRAGRLYGISVRLPVEKRPMAPAKQARRRQAKVQETAPAIALRNYGTASVTRSPGANLRAEGSGPHTWPSPSTVRPYSRTRAVRAVRHPAWLFKILHCGRGTAVAQRRTTDAHEHGPSCKATWSALAARSFELARSPELWTGAFSF